MQPYQVTIFQSSNHFAEDVVLVLYRASTVGKKKISIYFNINNRTEMKLVPFIMDYYPLQFDALKFFLGLCLSLKLSYKKFALTIIPPSYNSQTN